MRKQGKYHGFLPVFRKSYLEKMFNPGSVILVVLTIVGLLVAIFWRDITGFFEENRDQVIMVTDESGLAGELSTWESTEFGLVAADEDPRTAVEAGEALAWITVTPGEGVIDARVVSGEPLGMNQQMEVDRILGLINRNYAAVESGIDPVQLAALEELVPNTTSEVLSAWTEGKTVEERQSGVWVAYFIAFVMYFFISMYGGLIIGDIAEEKSMRIMEVLLSSISPMTHLLGKVLSVIAMAISQVTLIGVALVAAMQISGMRLGEMLRGVSPDFLVWAIILLLLSVYFYVMLGAMMGSTVNRPEEASQATAPQVMMAMVSFLVAMSGMMDPNSPAVRIFAYLPFSSAMVMPMYYNGAEIPDLVPWVAVGILVLTDVLLTLVTRRIYHNSVLSYRSGSLREKIRSAWAAR